AGRILLIDDHAINRQVAQSMLEREGFAVETAAGATAALQRAATQAFDLVLLDVRMPGVDGLDLARQLRARPGSDALPLIAVTADTMPETRAACFAAG